MDADRYAAAQAAVLDAYGHACACCGATTNLRIDDIDAATHPGLRHLGGGGFYRWLIVHGFPAGFQTLCASCNCSKKAGKLCKLHRETP